MSTKLARSISFYVFAIGCLGPTFFLFILGLTFAHHQLVYHGKIPPVIVVAAIPLLSAAWTLFRFEQLTIRSIPKIVWGSYAIGILLTAYLSLPFIFQTGFRSSLETLILIWSLGVGPLIYLVVIIYLLSRRV